MIKPITPAQTFAISPPPYSTFFPHHGGNLYLIDCELCKHTSLYTSYQWIFHISKLSVTTHPWYVLNRITITIAVISANEVFKKFKVYVLGGVNNLIPDMARHYQPHKICSSRTCY